MFATELVFVDEGNQPPQTVGQLLNLTLLIAFRLSDCAARSGFRYISRLNELDSSKTPSEQMALTV